MSDIQAESAQSPHATSERQARFDIGWTVLLLLLAGGAVLGGGNFLYPYLAARNPLLIWNAAIGLPLGTAAIGLSLSQRVTISRPRWIVPGVLGATLAVQLAARSWWPNSADEYGYVFLARTLLHGRVWNPPPPAPQIFEIAWTFTRHHEWFSQYPPAFPVLLMPFLAAGLPWLINPLLTMLLASLTSHGLRRSGVRADLAWPLLFLLMFSPFVLFNGASLFSHTLSAALVMGIVLLQAREESRAGVGNRLGIGAVFGALLLTRYDVFLLTASLFVIDRLWHRRAAFLGQALGMAAGGLPFIACFVAYNLAITGRPFETPYAWVSAGARIGLWGKHVVFADALLEASMRTLHWAGEAVAYTSSALLLLAALALVAHLRSRTLRWHDMLLPTAIVFFFLYPNNGGHEFGPRYWFFAWAPAVLSIGRALSSEQGRGDWLQAGRLRLHAPTLAAVHGPLFLGASLSLSVFNHLYVDQRRLVENLVAPLRPAVILIPTRSIMVTPWQTTPIVAHSADFCRNGVDLDRDVLYARADNARRDRTAFTALACTLIGRHVFRWQAPGSIEPVTCP